MKKWLLCASMLLALLLCLTGAMAEESHPGMMTINGGRSVGDGSYINHDNSGYPFLMEFELDEKTIPLKSCRLGIFSWDCDEDSTGRTREYDMVFVNGKFVGVLTGQNNTWKTSYFDVPLSALKLGKNEITVYVGHCENATGDIVQNSSIWLLSVDWASLQFDGGSSQNAPSSFNLDISYAVATSTGVECGATVTIQNSNVRTYVIEYSLVDQNPGSPSNGQIIADDSETVSGTSITSVGQFYLGQNPPMGNYLVEVTLRDPVNNEVLASDRELFNLDELLNGSCDHEPEHAQNTYRRTAYRRLDADDPLYDTNHEQRDIYSNLCSLCGKLYEIPGDWALARHNGRICDCGYVEPGYNPILSAEFSAVGANAVYEYFMITVVADEAIKQLTAVNNSGFTATSQWVKSNNGDGTVTWTLIYQADSVTSQRYWIITSFNANGHNLGSKNTNPLDILKQGEEAAPAPELTGTYTIQVVDADTGKKIPNAAVALCDQGASTDARGKAVFQRAALTNPGSLLVVAKGYPDYRVSGFVLSDMGYSVVTLSAQKGTIIPQTCNGEDINSGKSQLNVVADLTAEIVLTGNSHNEIIRYDLLQSGTVIASSANGEFSVHNSCFTAQLPIVARMTSRAANGVEYQVEETLHIDVVSQGIIEIDLSGIPLLDGISFNLSDALPLLEKTNFEATTRKGSSRYGEKRLSGKSEGEIGNYSILVGYGITEDESLVKLNSGLKNWHYQQGHKVREKGASGTVGFVLEIKFDKTGVTEVVGKLSTNASFSASLRQQLIVVTVPVAYEVSGELHVGAYAENIGYSLSTRRFTCPAIGITGGGSISAQVGLGFTYLSAGVCGSIGLEVDASTPLDRMDLSGTVTPSGEIGLYVEIGKWPLYYKGQIRLWPEDPNQFDPIPIGHVTPRNRFSPQNPLTERSLRASAGTVTDVGYTTSPYSSGKAVSLGKLPSSVADPQIAATDAVTVMTYITEDPADAYNSARAAYRVLENGRWSAARWVEPTGLVQGEISLFQQGDDVYLAMSQLNRKLTASDMPSDSYDLYAMIEQARAAMGSYEIVVARYDAAAQAFVPMPAVTADQSYDMMPEVMVHGGRVYAAWVKNPSNEMLPLNDQNQIMLAVYENGAWRTSTLCSGTAFVARLALGVLDNQVCVAMVQHPRNDLNELQNRTVTLVRSDGQMLLKETGACDTPTFTVLDGQQTLLWYSNKQIKQIRSFTESPSVLISEDYMVSAGYRIATQGNRTMLLYTMGFTAENGDVSSDVCAMNLAPEMTSPVRLTENGGYADVFDAALTSSTIELVMIHTEVELNDWAYQPRHTLYAQSKPYAVGLMVDSVVYNESAMLPDNTVDITVFLVNTGTEKVSTVTVRSPEIPGLRKALAVSIPSGGAQEATFSLAIPEDLTGDSLTLTFSSGSGQHTAQVKLPVKQRNVSLGAQSMVIGNAQQLLYSIRNYGRGMETVRMNIRQKDANGAVLLAKDFVLTPHDAVNDFMDVSALVARLPANEKELYVELVVSEEDGNPYDNAVTVQFYGN